MDVIEIPPRVWLTFQSDKPVVWCGGSDQSPEDLGYDYKSWKSRSWSIREAGYLGVESIFRKRREGGD